MLTACLMAVCAQDHRGTDYHEKAPRKYEIGREHPGSSDVGVTVIQLDAALGSHPVSTASQAPAGPLQCCKGLRLWEKREGDAYITLGTPLKAAINTAAK